MADAIVNLALEQLLQITTQNIGEEVRLVGNVENEVEKLRSNLEAIQTVLLDAEERQMKGDRAVRRWLDKLKDISYDIEDVLDEWNTEIMRLQVEGDLDDAPAPKQKVPSFFPCSCFGIKQVVLRRDIAQKIKELNEKLDIIAEEKNKYSLEEKSTETFERVQTTSFVDVTEIYGREYEKNSLLSTLLDERNEEHKNLSVISLVGMGGIGKTTLAQQAYNNDKVMSHFDTKIWVCVSNPFDEIRVAKAIIEGLECPTNDFVELESFLKCIRQSIMETKFLLILDDMWSEDYNKWEPFYHCLKNGSYGSKVLITTRNERVASIMGSVALIIIEQLAPEECWLLFRQFAFYGRPSKEFEKLEKIGREIVAKCKGLPLAAKTMGNLLRFKKTRNEWQRILDSDIWTLEEIGKGLLSPLMLSYNDLPSSIRRCFSYCAIFPKDHNIEKDDLIKLWMAQGYLGLDNDTKMEVIGQEYFDHLASRSFFQEFEKDDDQNIISCKMHDIVHDFAQFLTKNECFTVGIKGGNEDQVINTSNEKTRHSMLMLHVGATFPISVSSIKSLRSLLIGCEDSKYLVPDDVRPNLFGELTSLRALHISAGVVSANLITVIPKEVKKLIHLKYLNLSSQHMEKLPETLCELYNLQTLDISWCQKLKELPQGMGKLINLRHLINYFTISLSYMPKGIEKLTCLRTLSAFIEKSRSSDGSKACSTLACLKDLKHLRGTLYIRGLGNVTNVSEVKRMQILSNKENLFHLWLRFDKDGEGERKNDEDELLLEALQPHPNLEKLHIENYRGSTFYSDWIMSLTGLRELRILFCRNLMHLSPLGKLPSLESLWIREMSVKKVVTGIEGDGAFSSSTSVILFPKLKVLDFMWIWEWEEWDYGNTILPCLASLHIHFCPKLRALPDGLLQGAKNLQHLEIIGSDLLEERYKKGTGEDWQKISHIPNIKFADSYLQGGPLPLR
ncbi:putative disease resistance protein RGA4 [Mangifera indica]|uniref:putative disease resistance protein RGA4 n=1 Tax=Mangifera indica TaxID=29780 RepID=UPI001CF9FF7C|nr:putative disease resistance protein RGA4 [Mangifera indica]XP_044497212.1 putative disease resistance protein RGA4 [Mangifera indica]XP_044497213.1 putative disease resistance protein RGA4 [Mangifera indica]XP_044497214.1 putative disease resistance protein RGA4 [Mangifera indica]XP_044497216.1 putative disease resistance protein RGA4 [Mangifera indica]XP_044497217.1 putative disease resistance protein RGA4 [Mangifera indica]XP_044497218.1 putative disease resistance protein RGA4 [Mangifer